MTHASNLCHPAAMGVLSGLAHKALEASNLAASLGLSAGIVAATLPVRAGAFAVQVGLCLLLLAYVPFDDSWQPPCPCGWAPLPCRCLLTLIVLPCVLGLGQMTSARVSSASCLPAP